MIPMNVATELGKTLCEQWGLDPNHVAHIEIHLRPGEMPYAVVEVFLTEGTMRQLLTLNVGDRHEIADAP